MNDKLAALRDELARIVGGAELSLTEASDLELHVQRSFRGTPLWERLSGVLALYRPEGGEHLFDQQSLRRELAGVLADWDALTSSIDEDDALEQGGR